MEQEVRAIAQNMNARSARFNFMVKVVNEK
jgi:hypothetical protein